MLYRVSPLHSPFPQSIFSEEALSIHSQRFHNMLKGDVLLGVHVEPSYLNDASTAYGSLRRCSWTDLNQRLTTGKEGRPLSRAAVVFKGIQMDVHYEKSTFTSLLLQSYDVQTPPTPDQAHLPLLMTKMSTVVREHLLTYLATTFDVRVDIMRLSSKFMANVLEIYLQETLIGATETSENVRNGVQLVLGFHDKIAPALQNLSIDIPREDVLGFYKKGKAVLEDLRSRSRQTKAGLRPDEQYNTHGPFMAAVHVSRNAPEEALIHLLGLLIDKAATRMVGNN